jgi:phosphatidylglycerophosphatase A
MLKLHQLILTLFYFGKFPKAPGTMGSLVALIFWFFTNRYFYYSGVSFVTQNLYWTIFLTAIFLYGCFFIRDYTKQFRQIDHQSIVLDEALGQILALQLTFLLFREDYFSQNYVIAIHLLFCFISFRFFDITKPSIIGLADRVKTGFGVMLDDLLCGIITAILGAIIFYAWNF